MNTKHDAHTLAEVVDLMLWTGQLLMQFGADSLRIERNINRMAAGLGCTDLDIFISHHTIMITTIGENGFRTKIRNVKKHGVNMTIISAISKLSWRVMHQKPERSIVRQELQRISHISSHYPRWLVIVMVGLACASFSRLFGGDWIVFLNTLAASSLAMFVRQELVKKGYNQYIIVIASSFTAAIVAGISSLLDLSPEPTIALVASVLLFVPGVPMINSVKDMVDNYTMVGLTRAIIGVLISLCIALGLIIAMSLLGIQNL